MRTRVFQPPLRLTALCVGLALALLPLPSFTADLGDPEAVLRLLVRANEERDLPTMARYMAQDADVVGYSIGGRKYVGWSGFAAEMQHEFESVSRLEILITDLKVWTRGDVAWFAMELDYIRYVGTGPQTSRAVIPLRETGVLERRNGQWILVGWHESSRSGLHTSRISSTPVLSPSHKVANTTISPEMPDLSGEWEVVEVEDNKTYRATLDRNGNGPYTWQGGRFATTGFNDRRWRGTWSQTGNDREGGFDLLLTEDGLEAKGVWWYTRVGDRKNIPPRQWGGSYVWKRLSSSHATVAP